MPYKVGDATPGADNFGIEPLDSTSLGLPNLSWLSTQARPKDAYDTYWRNASRVPAGPVGDGLPGRAGGGNYQASGINPTPGLSSFGFEALQMGPSGPNTVGGGLSLPNLAAALDPVRYSAHVPAPPLAPGVAGQPIGKPGQATLDLIHPFTSFAQATGPYVGQAQLFGAGAMGQTGATGIDPMAFLAQRHVELLGNAPSRALDYLAAPFLVAARHLVGQAGPVSTSGEGLVKYAFQKDPNYWLWIRQANDTFMQQQAINVANEYAPGYQNQGMQAALIEQFKRDKNTMLGLSSGDEAIDYRAKQHLAELIRETGADPSKSGALTNLLGELGQIPSVFLPALPVVGTQLGQFLDPVKPDTEAAWQKLTPEERGALLQTAGLQQTFGSMIATLPAFSGLGAVAAFGARAAEAGTFGGNIYRVYSTGIDVLAQAMKAGVGVALTNWAAEIAVPGYTDLIGREIDESRPVSDSAIGGMVNMLGYFASPADVLGPYLGLVTRPLRAAIGGGLKAIPLYKFGLGGVEMDATVARHYSGPDLSAQAFKTDAQALTLSEMQGELWEARQTMWQDAIKKGESAGNFPVDVISREQRIAHAEADLMNLPRAAGEAIEARVKLTEVSNRRPGFWDTAADRSLRERLGYIRQAWEDRTALRYTSQYGPEFFDHLLSRQGFDYSVAGFKGFLQAQAERMGWTVDMAGLGRRLGGEVQTGVAGKYLGIGGDIEKWQTLARKMYHREFAINNGQLIAATQGSEEAGRVMLARATHLFRADAVELAALIKDQAPEARAAAWQRIQNTEELAKWWAEEKPGATGGKGIEDVKLSRLAAHLDSLSPMLMAKRIHPDPASPTATLPLNLLARKLEAEGQWVVGFKPQYARAEGDIMAPHGDTGGVEPTFVSYTHIGDGEFLRSPYLDYPMSSSDLIKIGGEGYVATKLDGITRAFRSWRIGQFQEGLMHRIITRYDGVTAAQTDKFWHDVQDFAAAKKIGSENIGVHVSPLAISKLAHAEVQAIGERIFGNQPMRNLDTGLMEVPKWNDIARRSFSQSMKLNLTAGITSRFKQMGTAGEGAMLASEFVVPLVRFNLSPLFKIGEFVESKGLNFGRMGFDRVDPMTRPLWVRAGITRERAMMRSEISVEPQATALLTDPVAPRGTSAASFLTPTRSGRPNPIEAATAERPVPGIDMPGGAESLVTEAEVRYEAAKAAMDRAEQGLLESPWSEHRWGQADAVNQPRSGEQWRNEATPESWRAYEEAAAELDAARADLPEGGYLALMEKAAVARLNLARAQRFTEGQVQYAQRDLEMALAGLDALAKQVPRYAPLDPTAARVYHGTPAAFVSGKAEPVPAFQIGKPLHPDVPAHEEGYVYMSGYGDPSAYHDGQELHVADPLGKGGTWPDGSTAARRVFHETPASALIEARAVYADMLLRINRPMAEAANGGVPFKRDAVSGELFVEYDVDGHTIEYLGGNGEWHNVFEEGEPVVEGVAFDRSQNNPTSLYGPGTYFTDAPNVAKGYSGGYRPNAQGSPVVYGVDVPLSLRRLDLEGPVPADLQAALDERATQEVDGWLRYVEERRAVADRFDAERSPAALARELEAQSVGWTTDPAVLAKEQAHYEEVTAKYRAELDAAEAYFRYHRGDVLRLSTAAEDSIVDAAPQWARNMTEGNVWEALAESGKMVTRAGDMWEGVRHNIDNGDFGADVTVADTFLELNSIVDANGYDAMTHIGGQIYGTEPHNVTIVFDPSKVRVVEANIPSRVQAPEQWQRRVSEQEAAVAQHRERVERYTSELASPPLQAGYDEAVRSADEAAAALAREARQAGPPPATELADIPGQAEHFERVLEETIDAQPRGLRKQLREVLFPQEMKERAAHDLTIKLFRDIFPAALKASGSRVAALLRDELHVPESEWAQFMIEDKIRLQAVQDGGGTPESWQALFDHADKYTDRPAEGMVRLWRGDTAGGERAGLMRHEGPVPDWMKEDPDYKATVDATGRWYTNSPEAAQYYVEHFGNGKGKVSYVDVTAAQYEAFRVANQPASVRRFSGDHANEWFVPREVADRAQVMGPKQKGTAGLDALYQTPEWNVVSSLWLASEQAARDEAFGVHFFSKYRSPFARSINHPLLGVYPAAWAFKVAKEWFRFLYDNRAFGNGALRLGMTPAVAINHIEDQQNRLMALTGSTMDDVIGFGGPLSSAFFMFNLILPGDWSGLPFPFSRSIRLAMRGDFSPWSHIQQNTFGVGHSGGMGVLRDLRAGSEAAGEIAAAFGHIRSPGEVDFGKIGTILSRGGVPPRPVEWRQVGNYPSK